MSKYQVSHSAKGYWTSLPAQFMVSMNKHFYICCKRMTPSSTEMKRNFNGHEETSLHARWKPQTGRKWNLTSPMLSFQTITFAIIFCVCQRRMMHSMLRTLDRISQVYKTDAVAQLHTTPNSIPSHHPYYSLPWMNMKVQWNPLWKLPSQPLS